MKKILTALFIMSMIALTQSVIASNNAGYNMTCRKGCCSRHGGVKGCASNGHAKCNDGTTSPKCKC